MALLTMDDWRPMLTFLRSNLLLLPSAHATPGWLPDDSEPLHLSRGLGSPWLLDPLRPGQSSLNLFSYLECPPYSVWLGFLAYLRMNPCRIHQVLNCQLAFRSSSCLTGTEWDLEGNRRWISNEAILLPKITVLTVWKLPVGARHPAEPPPPKVPLRK